MNFRKYSLFILGLASINQVVFAEANLKPGQPRARFENDILEVEVCYNRTPDKSFQPAMSLSIGKFATSGTLRKSKDESRPSCYSMKSVVRNEVVRNNDVVQIMLDGVKLTAPVEASMAETKSPGSNSSAADKVPQFTAVLENDRLEIGVCYSKVPSADSKPAMSITVGSFATSGFLNKSKKPKEENCYTLIAGVTGKGVKIGDSVAIKLDGKDAKVKITSAKAAELSEAEGLLGVNAGAGLNRGASGNGTGSANGQISVVNDKLAKAEKLGAEFAKFRMDQIKSEAKALYIILDQIQEMSSQTNQNPEYNANFREIFSDQSAKAEREGFELGKQKAIQESSNAAGRLVGHTAEADAEPTEADIRSTINEALSSFQPERKNIQSQTVGQFFETNWKNDIVRAITNKITGLSNENAELIAGVNSDLIRFAVDNVRGSLVDQISATLLSDDNLLVKNEYQRLKAWNAEIKERDFPNSQQHRELSMTLQADATLAAKFNEAYVKTISNSMTAVRDSLNSLQNRRNPGGDAVAMATGFVFNSLKDRWITAEAKTKAYNSRFAESNNEGFRSTYENAFRSEVQKTLSKLAGSSRLVATKGYSVLIGSQNTIAEGNNVVAVGVGSPVSLLIPNAKNIGGQPMNATVSISGNGVLVATGNNSNVSLGAKQSADLQLKDVARISAGSNNSTILNETYSATISLAEVSATIRFAIDWKETLRTLANEETNKSVGQEIVGFIGDKLKKEWDKNHGNLIGSYYKKADEKGGTSLLAMLDSFISNTSGAARAEMRGLNLVQVIRSAYPSERPSFPTLSKTDYDVVQSHIEKISQKLNSN